MLFLDREHPLSCAHCDRDIATGTCTELPVDWMFSKVQDRTVESLQTRNQFAVLLRVQRSDNLSSGILSVITDCQIANMVEWKFYR